MNDDAPIAKPAQSETATPAASLPWFTADELPVPSPEMRRPPRHEEPSLFDDVEEE